MSKQCLASGREQGQRHVALLTYRSYEIQREERPPGFSHRGWGRAIQAVPSSAVIEPLRTRGLSSVCYHERHACTKHGLLSGSTHVEVNMCGLRSGSCSSGTCRRTSRLE